MTNDTTKLAVAKFGGTSVIKHPKKIKEISESTDVNRKFIVVSAPGIKTDEDKKLTDILFYIVDTDMPKTQATELIVEKLRSIGIPFDTDKISEEIHSYLNSKQSLATSHYRARMASLGEHLCALIYSEYLGAEYLDPHELFVLDSNGDHSNARLNFEATKQKWDKINPTLDKDRYVIPGYYGLADDGNTALFSRGGSDLTGAYIAYFTESDVYENFTDSQILTADPKIIDSPKQVDVITFKELRDLTYSGFNILHHDVIRPLAEKNILIEVRGTTAFPQKGTIVVERRIADQPITGIAFADGFMPINIYMPGLHEQPFALSDTLQILRNLEIPVEHVSTGIDDISVVVRSKYFNDESLSAIITQAKKTLGNKVELTTYENLRLGLLTVVGEGMKSRIGISGEIQQTLAKNNVNIYAIDQSITERNIIYCIESEQSAVAIKGIYKTFITN